MVVCGFWALLAPAAQAAPSGSIVGTVTAADTHTGLEGAEVCASRFVESEEGEGERLEKCDEAGPTGAYSIEALEEGEYEVEFRPGELPYFGQYREGLVTVADGPSTGVNAELAAAAMIAGTVTAGGQLADEDKICAWRLPSAEKGLCARAGKDGRYAIRFASPGDFRVEFQARKGNQAQDRAPQAALRQASQAPPSQASLDAPGLTGAFLGLGFELSEVEQKDTLTRKEMATRLRWLTDL